MLISPEPHGEIGALGSGAVKDAPLGAPLRGSPYGAVLDSARPESRLASKRLRRGVSGAINTSLQGAPISSDQVSIDGELRSGRGIIRHEILTNPTGGTLFG